MQKTFYSNGKLLISGEYAILEGALGLAIPVRYGQSLRVTPTTRQLLQWTSLNEDGTIWFQGCFNLHDGSKIYTSDQSMSQTLAAVLSEAKAQNPEFLSHSQGIAVQTQLNFPHSWGLGASSTLINNVAQWAQIDAYQLLWNTFGGSGYDIACAQHPYPITYQLEDGIPKVEQVAFNPPFKNSLYFVYLNQKQCSKAAVAAYKKQPFNQPTWLANVSLLTKKMMETSSLTEFEAVLEQHEALLSKVLGIPPIKTERFSDYPGAVKSLGAWGGDFVLATGTPEAFSYFNAKGFSTVIPYADMVL